ncbi:MAG: preprotein translocase subunit YajC [Planctomycetota bacterium]
MNKTIALALPALACTRTFAYGQQSAAAPANNFMEIFLLFILPFIVIFYFFFIRPQRKQQKKRETMLTAVEKGDRVVTIGGIIGRVTNVTEKTVTVEIDEKHEIRVKLLRRSIASIKGKTEDMDDVIDEAVSENAKP